MQKRNDDKMYWCETFGAWPVEDEKNLFQMTVNEYPLIITFTYEEYSLFKKDIISSVTDDSVDEDDFVIQDKQSIRVYNGVNDYEKYMFILIKNKDLSFGLPNNIFKKFKKDVLDFSPLMFNKK